MQVLARQFQQSLAAPATAVHASGSVVNRVLRQESGAKWTWSDSGNGRRQAAKGVYFAYTRTGGCVLRAAPDTQGVTAAADRRVAL
jgi:hypothetical protein